MNMKPHASPAYLCGDLADFLRSHDRGVFWLQAPAHVGKTTFVQALTEVEIGDAPCEGRRWARARLRLFTKMSLDVGLLRIL
jgi:hypothetical protein